MSERWADVPGFANYEVSDLGHVRRNGRVLRPNRNKRGYMSVQLSIGGVAKRVNIHRIVLMAFVGPCPEGMEACHNNGNASDASLKNLRWDTRRNNLLDMWKHGTVPQRRLGQRSREHVIPPGKPSHCKYGHAYTPENSFVRLRSGTVECRECQRRRDRAARAKRAAEKAVAA